MIKRVTAFMKDMASSNRKNINIDSTVYQVLDYLRATDQSFNGFLKDLIIENKGKRFEEVVDEMKEDPLYSPEN